MEKETLVTVKKENLAQRTMQSSTWSRCMLSNNKVMMIMILILMENKESWSSGLNQAEQMHILASANNISPSKKDIEFSKNDLKGYKKQAKRYFKNKSWEKPPMKIVPITPTLVLIGTVNGTVYPVWLKAFKGAHCFLEVILSIVNDDRK